RNAEDSVPYEKSLYINRYGVANRRREQAPALLSPITFYHFTFHSKTAFAEQLQTVIGGAYP
ncbi:MAG: hypothetical protein ACI4IX_09040, partial [Acutalibacteraceae bacterium]